MRACDALPNRASNAGCVAVEREVAELAMLVSSIHGMRRPEFDYSTFAVGYLGISTVHSILKYCLFLRDQAITKCLFVYICPLRYYTCNR